MKSWARELAEVIMKVRGKAELRSALLRTIVLGVLFGLTFLQIEKTQTEPWQFLAASSWLLPSTIKKASLATEAIFTINGCIFFTMMMGVMNIVTWLQQIYLIDSLLDAELGETGYSSPIKPIFFRIRNRNFPKSL